MTPPAEPRSLPAGRSACGKGRNPVTKVALPPLPLAGGLPSSTIIPRDLSEQKGSRGRAGKQAGEKGLDKAARMANERGTSSSSSSSPERAESRSPGAGRAKEEERTAQAFNGGSQSQAEQEPSSAAVRFALYHTYTPCGSCSHFRRLGHAFSGGATPPLPLASPIGLARPRRGGGRREEGGANVSAR